MTIAQQTFQWFICLCLMLQPLHASAAYQQNGSESSALGQNLALITGPSELFLLAALNGSEKDSIAAVEADFQKEHITSFSQVTLNGNDFEFEGKKTGIHILQRQPFRVEFGTNIWSYNSKNSFDKNYFDLKKMLTKWANASTANSAFLGRLFLPVALATANENKISFFMGAIGFIVGTIVGVSLLLGVTVSTPVLLGGVAVATIFAAVFGHHLGTKQDEQERSFLARILRSKFDLFCSDQTVVLKSPENSQMELSIDKLTGKISYREAKGYATVVQLGPEQKNAIKLLNNCQNASQANQIKSALKSAVPAMEAESAHPQKTNWENSGSN